MSLIRDLKCDRCFNIIKINDNGEEEYLVQYLKSPFREVKNKDIKHLCTKCIDKYNQFFDVRSEQYEEQHETKLETELIPFKEVKTKKVNVKMKFKTKQGKGISFIGKKIIKRKNK